MTDDDIHELLATLDDWRTWKRGSGRAAPDALGPQHIAECLRFLLAERAELREAVKPLVYKPVEEIFKGLSDEAAKLHLIELDISLWDMRRARAALPVAPIAQVVQPKLNT